MLIINNYNAIDFEMYYIYDSFGYDLDHFRSYEKLEHPVRFVSVSVLGDINHVRPCPIYRATRGLKRTCFPSL